MASNKRPLSDHEERTIRAFVLPDRQERELLLLARGDYDSCIWPHRAPLDATATWRVPADWSADHLLENLRRRGSPETAVGIGGRFARAIVPLPEAIHAVYAARYGDLISLIPGRLAYYDGEEQHASYVLSR